MHISDERLDIAIGHTLQTGVFLAAALVLAGGILYLLRAPIGIHPDYRHFHGVAAHLKTPAGIWHGVLAGRAGSLIQLGLLVLIATPVARVILAGVGFFMQRDRLYVWVSVAVLAVLIYSLLHIH